MQSKLNDQSQIKFMAHLFELLWKYDFSTEEFYVYFDKTTSNLQNNFCKYDYIFNLYLNNYIHEIDKKLWKYFLSKDSLYDFLNSENENINFYIRFIKDKTSFEWYEFFITKFDDKSIIISSHNASLNYQHETISKAIGTEFDYILDIDTKDSSYILYLLKSQNSNNSPIFPSYGENYYSTLSDYYSIYGVLEENNELFEQLKLENIVEQLKNNKEYILYSTIFHNNKYFYKKLRFIYLNSDKEHILLSCIDISDSFKEYKILKNQVNKYQNQLISHLDNMPIAYCTAKILVDNKEKPYDFVFTYSNKAHSKLEGVEYGELIGKSFYKFFGNSDQRWLKYYSDTAFNGTPYILDMYSSEINKHLLIHTYQPADSFCGCVVQDISLEKKLEAELKQSQERINLLLDFTTDTIFQYDLETKTIFSSEEDIKKRNLLPKVTDIPYGLIKENLLAKESLEDFEKAIALLESGEKEVSFNIRLRFHTNEVFKWFNLTFFSYNEIYTNKLCTLGYLKDIDNIIQQQELLKVEAELDPLTGLLNVRTGKKLVKEHLSTDNKSKEYNVMLLMDLDNFKGINDTLGHQMGDQILKKFSKILLTSFRNTDIIYRLGGDEFAVFIKNVKNPQLIIKRIMEEFFFLLQEKDNYPQFSSSVGIFITNKNYNYEHYYFQADKALYQAKQHGKNSFKVIFD